METLYKTEAKSLLRFPGGQGPLPPSSYFPWDVPQPLRGRKNVFFFFKLYNIVLVLPNIEMDPPQVYFIHNNDHLTNFSDEDHHVLESTFKIIQDGFLAPCSSLANPKSGKGTK